MAHEEAACTTAISPVALPHWPSSPPPRGLSWHAKKSQCKTVQRVSNRRKFMRCAVFSFSFFVHCRALYCMIFYQLAAVVAAAAAAVAGFDTNFERCGAPQNIAQSVNMVEDF